jgi:hypothetical protein
MYSFEFWRVFGLVISGAPETRETPELETTRVQRHWRLTLRFMAHIGAWRLLLSTDLRR